MRRKAAAAPLAVQALAWAAQKRLCMRYRHLYHAGKKMCVVITAVARELVGFVWADCLRGDGPAPCDAGAELRDGPQFSTSCPPLRQCLGDAAPWTRRGELLRCIARGDGVHHRGQTAGQ